MTDNCNRLTAALVGEVLTPHVDPTRRRRVGTIEVLIGVALAGTFALGCSDATGVADAEGVWADGVWDVVDVNDYAIPGAFWLRVPEGGIPGFQQDSLEVVVSAYSMEFMSPPDCSLTVEQLNMDPVRFDGCTYAASKDSAITITLENDPPIQPTSLVGTAKGITMTLEDGWTNHWTLRKRS